MEQIVSFKTRVKNCAIENAQYFNEIFVKYDYLVFTEAVENKCFEIKATEGNFLHLVGVSTPLTPVDFFQKCIFDCFSLWFAGHISIVKQKREVECTFVIRFPN